MGFKNWETPKEFFKELDKEFHFTLDAAASHENTLCVTYCTPDGIFYTGFGGGPVSMSGFFGNVDGLTMLWNGHRVFCNPPYDHTLTKWVEKAATSSVLSVLLLPPSIDTLWFHDYIWDDKTHRPRTGVEVRFHKGRLAFNVEGKPGKAPRAGNMVVVFHNET